ncbi:MAG: M23 family metallopeptidase [Actinobacteria bacterium]|nr:M23 family metallopeptidase [Actinomycetota bacterium]
MNKRTLTGATTALALCLGMAACGDDGGDATPLGLSHADVSGQYGEAMDGWLREGRAVVDSLITGKIGEVYDRTSPEVKAQVTLAEVEQLFRDATARGEIGSRQEDRAVPLGPDRGLYWADHAWADGRVRFTLAFTPSGLQPTVEPVRPLPPDPREGRPARARLRLPFEGLWWAFEGPSPEIGAHHAVAPDQRHAYDFAIWRDGGTYRGSGADNADYWCWGEPVLAPASAEVVSVRDGISDNRPGVETNTAQATGNHVILDLEGDEYAFLAHFQKGSITVAQGDRVDAGEVLGKCGNSGNSSEPHIHFHLQDRPTFQQGGEVGLPLRFDDYVADGVHHQQGTPSSGQFVSPKA